jgi:hypothetical protein
MLCFCEETHVIEDILDHIQPLNVTFYNKCNVKTHHYHCLLFHVSHLAGFFKHLPPASSHTHNINIVVAQLSPVLARTNNAQKLILNNLCGHGASENTGMQLKKCTEDDYVDLKKNNSDILNTETLSH